MDELAKPDAAAHWPPPRYYCVALHAHDGPVTLEWLQLNVAWKERELQWHQCHQLHNSTPEVDEGVPVDTRPVFLLVVSARTGSTESEAIEGMLTKVRTLVVWWGLHHGNFA